MRFKHVKALSKSSTNQKWNTPMNLVKVMIMRLMNVVQKKYFLASWEESVEEFEFHV